MVLNGQHLHAVRQNQPLKSKLFPEKACDHPPGHGAGQSVGLQGREEHMAHHNGRNALGNGPAEGDQLQRFQLLLGLVHAGKPQVAVHCRVSVARKMLGAAQNAAAYMNCPSPFFTPFLATITFSIRIPWLPSI